MTAFRRGRSWVRLAIVATLLVMSGYAGSLASAADPLPASISGVAVNGTTVSGQLTVRPGPNSARIDPGSLTATMGGRTADVQLGQAPSTTRRAVLLIDTSGSMGAEGMATVRAAVKDFLSSVPPDVEVGVVSFSSTAGAEIEPTLDRAAVQDVVDRLQSRGETALFDGVAAGVAMLGPTGERSLVLLSDGANTVGPRDSGLATAVAALTAARTRVEVVRFKTAENDPEALEAFATAGGGSVAQAVDTDAVRRAFASAAQVLETQVPFTVTIPDGASGQEVVALAGTAGGTPFRAETTVDLGAVTQTTAPSPTAYPSKGAGPAATPAPTATWAPRLTLVLGAAALFLGVLVIVIALLAPAFRTRRSERVASIEHYASAPARRSPAAGRASSNVAVQAVHLGDRVMEGRESTSRTMALIERADLPWRAGEWFVLRVVAIIVGAAALSLLMSEHRLIGFLLGAVIGFALPAMALRFLAARRARRFETILPDVLILVATSLSSGFSLPQALDAIARDAAEPAAKEFSRALSEVRIGADVADALEGMASRMDSENMRWTTMAIRIQRHVGGNLAETLHTTAKTLRERAALKGQVRALSAEGRLSAYILIGLPIALFGYMLLVNYAYVSKLWTDVRGIFMLFVGLILLIIGIFWMRKTVEIEV